MTNPPVSASATWVARDNGIEIEVFANAGTAIAAVNATASGKARNCMEASVDGKTAEYGRHLTLAWPGHLFSSVATMPRNIAKMGKSKCSPHTAATRGAHADDMELPQTRPSSARQWTTILLAGDRPGGDPLARQFGVGSKSLVPIGGRPMLAHVIGTLLNCPRIGTVIVLAQNPEELFTQPALAAIRDNPQVRLATSNGSIAASIAATLHDLEPDWPVLVTTADHVLLDSGILDWFLAEARACDVAVGMVNRTVAKRESLDTGRTWIRFRDVHITGANLFALRSARAFVGLAYWQRLEAHRKKPWRMAWEIGPRLLLQFVLGRLALAQAFAGIGARLGIDARAVQIPFARAGVDVDKVEDHTLVEGLLAPS